jgi:hypothetical protein
MNALNTALNTAFHMNAFDGFDAGEFDVNAYLGRSEYGFDSMDRAELVEHRSLTIPKHIDPANDDSDTEDYYLDEMDGDHTSALASAGFGTDEDYGYYGEEE